MKTVGAKGLFATMLVLVIGIGASLLPTLQAHDHSRPKKGFEEPRFAAVISKGDPENLCRLTLELKNAKSGSKQAGLIRIADSSGKYLDLREQLIDRTIGLRGKVRQSGWYVLTEKTELTLPRAQLKLEALGGLESELASIDLDLRGKIDAAKTVNLVRFFDAAQQGLVSGNTHLHLSNLTRSQADSYLKAVPRGDGVDIVFVSYLERADADKSYISNEYDRSSLASLGDEGLRFGGGEEYRHNMGSGGEGYGHVMFLDLKKRILPASLGPGITKEGDDGTPLRPAILKARSQEATVIWCHNTFGFEDTPTWAEGLVDAQNIFDGGTHGGYKDSFYRYLNAGMRVPFSTGTDWFVYDFSRVYVPLAKDEISPENWLRVLASGKSMITNSALLSLEVEGEKPGGTIRLKKTGNVGVQASVVGRLDFGRLQLIRNGEIIEEVKSANRGGHFEAKLETELGIDQPSWLALRIAPAKDLRNELDKPLFAHTSPVYVEIGGKGHIDPVAVTGLIDEIRKNMKEVREKGAFKTEGERAALLSVYRRGILKLEQRMQAVGHGR